VRACTLCLLRALPPSDSDRRGACTDAMRAATQNNEWIAMLSTPQLIEIQHAFAQFGAPSPSHSRECSRLIARPVV
jgi:hypothetical protein